ncbi:MAG: cupin domain-containing protein [bacterium]|nr:cupin domain-containing protein [bacterium]
MAHPSQTTEQSASDPDHIAVKVITLPTDPAVSYQSVIKPPLSHKLRSGFMRIQPGKACEEHSTDGYEELIVLLAGTAKLHHGDSTQTVVAGQVIYIPPHTKHSLENIGSSDLQYQYIVTKVEE